jgi:hypothetical protein
MKRRTGKGIGEMDEKSDYREKEGNRKWREGWGSERRKEIGIWWKNGEEIRDNDVKMDWRVGRE